MGYPFNTFLYNPNDKFNDFYHGVFVPFQDMKNFLIPYSGKWYPLPYFPLAFIISVPFALFKDWGTDANIYLIIISSFFFFCIYSSLNKYHQMFKRFMYSALLTITSYPLLFLLDRGSNEGILFIFIFLFMGLYEKGKYKSSIIPLSIAIGMKFYPITLLLLLLEKRKYMLTVVAFSLSIFLTILSMKIMGPIHLVWQEFGKNIAMFQQWTVIGTRFLENNHSLYNVINYLFTVEHVKVDYEKFIGSYFLSVCALFAVILFSMFEYNMKIWQKTTLLIFSMILLPFTSLNYTLISIYIPIMLFLAEETSLRSDLATGLLFGLLIVPKRYFGILPFFELDIILNPFIMLAIMSIILFDSISHANAVVSNNEIGRNNNGSA
jgi:hypothetical protein